MPMPVGRARASLSLSSPKCITGGKADVLREEVGEQRQYFSLDLSNQAGQKRRNLQTSCRSLIERYKDGNFLIHLHFHGFGEEPRYCLVIGSQADVEPDCCAGSINDLHLVKGNGTFACEQDIPVFVDVRQLVEDENDGVVLIALPKVVRLEALNKTNCRWGNAFQSAFGSSIKRSSTAITNGERVLVRGHAAIGYYQLCDKVVEGRSKILQNIASPQSDNTRYFTARTDRDERISCVILLTANCVEWIVEIPRKIGVQSVQMHI